MIYVKLILTAVFWGGTFIAGKLISTHVDPYSAAFFRFLIASVFLFFLTIKIEGRLPNLPVNKIVSVLLLGLTGVFFYNIFFFTGLNYIQANQASLIIACNPIFISICSVIFFKEKMSLLKITGLCLSVTGAIIVISRGNPLELLSIGIGKGELLIFGCVASWVTYSILGRSVMKDLSPIASVFYSSVAGTLLLFFPALYKGMFTHMRTYQPLEWISLFYLGFFGTVLGFFWYYEGIQKIGPMKAGVFINLVPISAICMSYFILHEPFSTSLISGAACVITGVFLTNQGSAQK